MIEKNLGSNDLKSNSIIFPLSLYLETNMFLYSFFIFKILGPSRTTKRPVVDENWSYLTCLAKSFFSAPGENDDISVFWFVSVSSDKYLCSLSASMNAGSNASKASVVRLNTIE